MRIRQGIFFLKKNRVNVILSFFALLVMGAVLTVLLYTADTYKPVSPRGENLVSFAPVTDFTHGAQEEAMSYRELSEVYKSLKTTCEAWTSVTPEDVQANKKGGLYFISQGDQEFCIYHADSGSLLEAGYTLQNFDHIWLNSEHNFFYMVVNLGGEEIDLTDYYVVARDETAMYASRVLINCYEAETVRLNGAVFSGTLLAPQATVICEDTYVYGQILAKEITGTKKADKDIPFTGYQAITDGLGEVSFRNEGVRIAAVNFLKTHNEDGRYDAYTEESQILRRDLQAITQLSIQDCSLESLEQDLAKFKHLTSLKIHRTNLTQISLIGQGGLVELEITDTPLASLDLTDVPLLKRLVLDRTELTELSLFAVPDLSVLSYQGTALGWMDYTVLPKLQYLDCSGSGITQEVITGETLSALVTLRIEKNVEITEIDVASFPKLSRLDCAACTLTEIDLAHFPLLSYLRCSDNQISELDFSGFKQLYRVECYGDSLKSMIVTNWAEAAYADCAITRVQG